MGSSMSVYCEEEAVVEAPEEKIEAEAEEEAEVSVR